MQYVQEALFPDTDVIGTGRPYPWNPADGAPADTTSEFQIEVLFDEESVR